MVGLYVVPSFAETRVPGAVRVALAEGGVDGDAHQAVPRRGPGVKSHGMAR